MDVGAILEKLILEDARAGDVNAILQLKNFLNEGQAFLESLYYDGNKENAVGKIKLREEITAIEDEEFRDCKRLEEIILPDGVTYIGQDAFWNCISLTKIKLPDSLTSINECVFWGCISLTEIKLPERLTSIGDWTFCDCRNLIKIKLPKSLSSINEGAFYACEKLQRITLPAGITSIGECAFEDCINLEEIDLPESLTSIGDFVFENCRSLNEINLPKNLISIGECSFWCCTSLTEIKLPDSLTSIGECAFEACINLEEIKFPCNLISVGEWAFNGCRSLKKISYYQKTEEILKECFGDKWDELEKTVIDAHPVLYYDGNKENAVGTIYLREGITAIEDEEFRDCKRLEKIVLPAGVTSIGKGAFSSCISLTEIILPEGVTSIGEGAFSGCISLKKVILPKSLISIGSRTFSGCNSLTEINLPDGLTSIRAWTFRSCNSLTEINLPKRLISIGNGAFMYCDSLKKISYYQKAEESLKECFGYKWDELEKTVIDAPPKITTENEFVKFAKERGIKYLVHFTRIENLPSIAKHGLLTRQNLDEQSLSYSFNDHQRLDKLINSLSLSVTFPNYEMLHNYSQGSADWAVILLDAEKILANLPCAFNASNHDIKEQMTLDAFKEMFYEPADTSRAYRNLNANETTDPQAEILCLANIPLEYFSGIIFKDSARATENQQFFQNVPCSVDSDYFSPRHDYDYWHSDYYDYQEEIW